MSARRQRLRRAHLYLVCGDLEPARLEAALRGGVDIVQLRCKGADEAVILAAAARVGQACQSHGALFILNDRPELVQDAGADGVHIGQDDAPVARARELVGPDRLVGLSTHSPAQIDAAGAEGVDYIGVGPVHATPTKPGRPAVGTSLVRYAAAHAGMPFFAIGGIDGENIAAVREAGAERVAVVRALTEATAPERAAWRLREALRQTEAGVGAT